MGFVSEELNETEKQLIRGGKASNMAVVYGKEASIWKVRTPPPLQNSLHPPPPPCFRVEAEGRWESYSRQGQTPAWALELSRPSPSASSGPCACSHWPSLGA